jgi:hypothetical protein
MNGHEAALLGGGGFVARTALSGGEPGAVVLRVSPQVIEVASNARHRREISTGRNGGAIPKYSSAVQSAAVRGHNNDLRLHLSLNVPGAGEVFSRMINQEMQDISFNAKKRTLKVCSRRTSPGSPVAESRPPDVSTRQARARVIARIRGREIRLSPADSNRPEVLDFKTRDGLVTLDLLQLLNATASANNLNTEAQSADSPLTHWKLIQWTTVAKPTATEDTH